MSSKPVVQQPAWHRPVPLAKQQPVLRIYNSLTRKKDEFIPNNPRHITWYCCGPTVYNHAHMGHARNYVCSDICRRILLDYFGYNVQFVQNVTDIDDKIIVAARQQYLFEEKILKQHTEKNADVVAEVTDYLKEYVAKNLTGFSGDILSQLVPYLDALEFPVDQPKLPMYAKAARDAHKAVFSDSDNAAFFSLVEDVAVPSLDKRYGSTVTDPTIFKKLPAYWENKFNEDMARLGVRLSTVTTRVLEYVPQIVDFVYRIIQNGFAYATSDGSVYFDTVKFESDPNHDYAKLQPWNKGSMELINDGEGSLSVTASNTKKSNADFALWKASKPGEPAWDSKFGRGRPGWHIECSVMASDILGENIDIHSGGIDLCFPHHDNELAQSEACFQNAQWINYFMHNGHLHIQGQKMSKSLKNFITVEDALETYTARQLRLVFAFGNWEKPLDFKDSLIQEVRAYESTLLKFFTTVRALVSDNKHSVASGSHVSKLVLDPERRLLADLVQAQDDAHAAFCDSLSTPVVLRVIADLVSKVNTYLQATVVGQTELRLEVVEEITRWITRTLSVLGFEPRPDGLGWVEDLATSLSSASTEDVAMPYVKALSQFRDQVRQLAIDKASAGDFLKACDDIRAGLVSLGISLDDRPTGSALVKFLNDQEKAEYVKQQQEKDKLAAEKELRKQEQAAANAQREQERLAKMKIAPAELFKDPEVYLEWDEQGLPTKLASGEEVTKSMAKKLKKQHQAQEKLHAEYLKSQSK